MRLLASTLLLAACAGGGAAPGEPEDARAPWERIDAPSLHACGVCHRTVYNEWAESLHARAWTNANVRNATKDFELESCRPCHSPRSVFETGFDRAPAFRDFNHEDGVHCLSCHGLEDGVAAARTIEDAPCRPRATPELLEADHCYPCHEPTHQAFTEYRTSIAFEDGTRCADCHMPRRAGGGRSHGPHGGMNAEFVAKALRWRCEEADGAVLVHLENLTGHKFPGEIPSRSLSVRVTWHDPVDGAASALLRRPHKGEERADNRLLPDEERTLRFEVPPGATGGEVRIVFVPLPLLPVEQGFLLGEWSF